MDVQAAWIDRGHAMDVGAATRRDGLTTMIAVSRAASVAVAAPAASVWIVLRGSAELECREGRFVLSAGEWISLERESCPVVYADGRGLVVGIALSASPHPVSQPWMNAALFPGRGTLHARAEAFRLWRRTASFARNDIRPATTTLQHSNQLLRFVAALQAGFDDMVHRCPGRSLRRKRQLFSRMQRARLHMEGHLGSATRVSELAEMSNMSIWYFTKTFHAIYGYGPQGASARLRLAHAADLLRATHLSVSEVGAACGFENNCSFSRAFRAQFGAPPSLYRLNGGGGTDKSGKATGHVRPSVAAAGSVTWSGV